MLIQTLPLHTIINKIRDTLKNDSDIADFCLTKYSKPLTLFVGINPKNPPKEAHCPFIVIFPVKKREGESLEEYSYNTVLWLGIKNDNAVTTGNVIEESGIEEISEFSQLVYMALRKSTIYIDSCVTDIEAVEFYPQHIAQMDIAIEIPIAIDGEIEF